jgi:hypothetical protein
MLKKVVRFVDECHDDEVRPYIEQLLQFDELNNSASTNVGENDESGEI